jgi:hypothetical protein
MQAKKKIFRALTSVYVLMAVLFAVGSLYGFFATIWWYDIPLHFLGGLWVSFSGVYIYLFSNFFSKPKTTKKTLFYSAFLTVLLLGIMWEIFEYCTGLSVRWYYSNELDTIKDIFMDLLGAILAYVYVSRIFKIHI